MKNICLITLNGNDNYGNKLQHYAVQTICQRYGCNVQTLNFLYYNRVEFILKHILKKMTRERYRNFLSFDKKINYYNTVFYKKKVKIDKHIEKKFDYFLVGSDQVWNASIKTFADFYLLSFIKNKKKKISISASFGIDEIPNEYKNIFKKNLESFNKISVREEKGKEIIEKLGIEKKAEVLVDPTMLLSVDDWNKVIKKPKMLKSKKYILNYFLGELSEDKKIEIEKISVENNCEIINLLDRNDKYYECGPGEFLYLEKNAFIVCTDSFHACVFGMIYNKPFIVFDRVQDNIKNTNSRIDTFLKKFSLEDRRYNGKNITKENLEHDYTEAYQILEEKRKKSDAYLKNALNIKKK